MEHQDQCLTQDGLLVEEELDLMELRPMEAAVEKVMHLTPLHQQAEQE